MQQNELDQPQLTPDNASPASPEPSPPRATLWQPMGWRTHALVVVGLLVSICATFSNSYQSGMALDNRYIIEEYYRTLLMRDTNWDPTSFTQIKAFFKYDYWWPKGISGLYRPITSLSYWLDYIVFTGKAPKRDFDGSVPLDQTGKPIPDEAWPTMTWAQYVNASGQLNTTSYHTVNLILHWVNAVLVYFVSLSLLKRLWPAALVAALFALHPITTESVTNIIGRADIFAAMSTFGGLLLYMRSLRSTGTGRIPWLAGVAAVCFVGFLAKESAIAIGAIIPLYWFTFEFDWSKFRGKFDQWAKPIGKELLVWCVMLPPLIGMLGLRSWVFANATPAEEPFLDNPIRGIWQVQQLNLPSFQEELAKKPLLGLTYLECKLTAVKIMGKLLTLLVWPATLCCDYSFDQIPNFSFTFQQGWDDWQAIIALGALAGIIALAVWFFRHGQKAAFFYIAFFFLAALPTSNFIVTIGSVMAERFMYLPLTGFTGAMVIGMFALGRWIWQRFKLDANPDAPAYHVIVTEVLAVIVVVYGVRGFMRNYVWQNDITLWQDAIKTSPRSFRCYQSLAFAMYERDPQNQKGTIDDIIAIDEQALPITDKLPNHLNSSRLYLHLGMYYVIKGDSLRQYQRNGDQITMLVPPAARAYYEKAVNVLEHGSLVDRSFNEVNHAKQVLRGDPPEKITDVGLAPVYSTMGMAYENLTMYDEAYKRYYYQRQLDPLDIDAYQRIANMHVQEGKLDLAAISLIEAVLLDSARPDLWDKLKEIYSRIGAPAQGALVMDATNQIRLNIVGNSMVREHLIAAYRQLIKIALQAQRYGMADDAYTTAVLKHGFAREHFDDIYDKPIDIIAPQGIVGQRPPIGRQHH